ncbi:MAG: DUF2079 domain-containing protein [Armatimonadetes bacterium]|nr:DUF2079 domain-containing protein [Armatimonadota bacterium]
MHFDCHTHCSTHKHHALLSCAISAIIMCFLTHTAILRHNIFGSGYDLAAHSQYSWLISHYGLLEPSTLLSSAAPDFYASPLADHLSIILIPLAIIYKFIPSPLTLIVIQAACAWLFIIGIIRIIHKRLGNQFACIITSSALSLYPPLHLQVRNDFHTDAFIMLSIPWLWVGITERRHWLFFSFLLLALLAKETGALVMLAFGVALLATRRYRRFGIWMCITSTAWFLTSQILLHMLRGGKPQPATVWYYGYLGSNLTEIILNAICHPSKPLKLLLSSDAILSAIQMLLPLLFLPVICPLFFFPSLTPFVQAFITTWKPTRNIVYQGMMQCTGLLILGCVEATALLASMIGKMGKDSERKARSLNEFALACVLLFSAIFSWQAVFPHQLYLRREIRLQNIPRVQAIRDALSLIPDNAPVIASTHLLPHLANRRFLWMFEWHNPLRDRRFELTPKWRGEMPPEDVYIAIELTPLDIWKPITPEQLDKMKRWREIETLVENKHIVLLRYCPHDKRSRVEADYKIQD